MYKYNNKPLHISATSDSKNLRLVSEDGAHAVSLDYMVTMLLSLYGTSWSSTIPGSYAIMQGLEIQNGRKGI